MAKPSKYERALAESPEYFMEATVEQDYFVHDPHFVPINTPPRQASAYTGVYAVRGAGLVKFGIAWDVRERLHTFRCGCPITLTPAGMLRCRSRIESHRQERAIHARFAAQRQHGEWFTETPEITAFISEAFTEWPT